MNLNIKNILEKNSLSEVQKGYIENKLPRDSFDFIVTNPPYIETSTIATLSKEVQHEPKIALDGGEDGLKFYRKIVKESWKYLAKQGKIFMEIGYNQKEKVTKLLQQENKYSDIHCIQDLAGRDRVIVAKIESEQKQAKISEFNKSNFLKSFFYKNDKK